MLFWRLRDLDEPGVAPGESWLYHQQHPTFCLGTSLCYWRSTWERKPFPDRSDGEDFWWQQGLQTCAVSSLPSEPRMIAIIHGSNAGQKHYDGLLGSHQAYERVPHWDDHCKKTLEAA